jgi:hypothetical protein
LGVEDLTEDRAIGLLASRGIVPETGWNKNGPATDVFLVQIQKTLHILLTDVATSLNIPVPPTLNLFIFTPGQMGGQTFYVRPQDMTSLRAKEPSPGPDKMKAGETAKVSIETPNPYPIGDQQLPAVWTYRLRRPGATFIKIHFDRLDVAAPDFIRVLDRYGQEVWRYVGGDPRTSDIWANAADGDTAIVALHADETGSGSGLKIDSYGFGLAAAAK